MDYKIQLVNSDSVLVQADFGSGTESRLFSVTYASVDSLLAQIDAQIKDAVALTDYRTKKAQASKDAKALEGATYTLTEEVVPDDNAGKS